MPKSLLELVREERDAAIKPTNDLIARKILQDTGETSSLTLTEEEVNRNFGR